jgi:protein-S-isoprenylcysteine O-methyltransferase Ste14
MLRVILEPALLFLSPFAAYLIYLYLRRRYPFVVDHWTRGTVSTLTLAGLAIAVAGLFLLGFFSERHEGAYAPAHIENGRLIPGHME